MIEIMKVERIIRSLINNADNKYDGLDDVDDLMKAIETNPRRTKNMIASVKHDYCEERNICYKCNEKMIFDTHLENRGECRGFPCYEEVGEYVCASCGYMY